MPGPVSETETLMLLGYCMAFAAAVERLNFLGRAPLPEVEFRAQDDMPARGRMLQPALSNRLATVCCTFW